ncbi:hypothetical protein G7Y89_g13853 [Cudoniella acicularis]|uniref:Methyltransferase domain-containing protein n=1 Tax=Cudoniella acicularis TaxID=354080 RepID=A0A8H4R652_9HELO|nr:hypothetical protein G7Y89_g13853 [Cudoniella acicularis]
MTALPRDSAISVGLSEEQQAALQAETSIDVDDSDGMSDVGYETDSVGTASTSLASSVGDYVIENGRRYHREDRAHGLIAGFCHRLHFVPIGANPQNILDMGTGTGIWATDIGDQYSSANILGVDLSPIQPVWAPPNVRFMVDDVESPWLHPRSHFDYIHSRHIVMAIRDWPRLMRRALDPEDGWRFAQYWDLVSEGLASLGVNSDATLLLADMMRDVAEEQGVEDAEQTTSMPCEENRSRNGAITNTRLQDDEIGTTDETGYHDDTVLVTEGEDTPSDAEFAALREMLPNDIGEGTTQGSEVVILSNALEYIQDLEWRNQRLRQENVQLCNESS